MGPGVSGFGGFGVLCELMFTGLWVHGSDLLGGGGLGEVVRTASCEYRGTGSGSSVGSSVRSILPSSR